MGKVLPANKRTTSRSIIEMGDDLGDMVGPIAGATFWTLISIDSPFVLYGILYPLCGLIIYFLVKD
ncbi:MAG: hypothetical protein ACE5R6_10465 [Candidatus Heimdallarchaeota archaeon]